MSDPGGRGALVPSKWKTCVASLKARATSPRPTATPTWLHPLLLAILLALVVIALLAVNAPGWYVADNRFEWFWSPGRTLSRSAWLWDSSRGIGRPRGEFALVPWSALAILRGLGASPALAERLWHAALLVTGGLGTVMLLRAFRPSLGPEHAVAGLFYALNPYAAVFLIPSGLFINYTIAPWLILAFVRGSTEGRPWRWAAIFSLAVLASGSTDPPGLIYALLLLIPTALYLVLIERRVSWRQLVGWLARAGLLSGLVSAAALAQILYGSAGLSTRLFSTESVEAVHSTVSWAESWRGLGFWVSYFSEGSRPIRPEHGAYLWSPPVIVATFIPACVATLAFGWSRWRPRLLMVGLGLVSLTLMVGAFPPDNPSPFGRLVLEAYERAPALTALRTSYKAGAGLAIGVACLVGLAVAQAARRLGRRRRALGAVPVAASALVISVISFPFWTGRLYPRENRMHQLPSYWQSAVSWLDQQPQDSRVLVLPGTSNSLYSWGSPGDDIFDALLARPHVKDESLPLSTPQAADLVAAIDARIQGGRYRPGTLGPIARRLGIEFVLVRNDLDWRRLQRVRPAALDALRRDQGLELAASFGRPGENVVEPGDRSSDARAEALLPPVQVYRLKDASSPVRVAPAVPPLLVSGDGEGWFQLAAEGGLEGTGPLRYTGSLEPGEAARLLRDGGRAVVTDTNRRRVGFVTRFGRAESHTLAPGEDLSRRATDLFERPGSQTVATFTDATRITSTATGSSFSGFEPWSRPANAFDGDETTAWLTEGIQEPLGRSVRVELRGPKDVSTVDVVAATQRPPGPMVSAATIVFSDGGTVPVDLSTGRARVSIPPRQTTSLEFRIDAVSGAGLGPVGFSEIRVGSLDLTEWMQVPDDLFRAADGDAALQGLLERSPLTYLFERFHSGSRDVEATMRRRFRSSSPRSYTLSGTLRLSRDAPEEVVDAAAGGPVGATGTSRHQGDLDHRGGRAVDGDPETGWRAPAQPGQTLTVRFPSRIVDRVTVTSASDDDLALVSKVRVRAGASSAELSLPAVDCPHQPNVGATRCPAQGVVAIPPVRVDRLTIEITELGSRPTSRLQEPAVEISEVAVGPEPLRPAVPAATPGSCLDGLVEVDGKASPVRIRGPMEDLLAGRPLPYTGCEPVELGAGWHRLRAGSTVVETASLTTSAATPAVDVTTPDAVEVIEREPTRLRLRLRSAEPGTALVTGQSYDKGWAAEVNGRDLGPPEALDTQTGWVIPRPGTHLVDVRYRPQRTYELALALTALGIAACLWLVLTWRRQS